MELQWVKHRAQNQWWHGFSHHVYNAKFSCRDFDYLVRIGRDAYEEREFAEEHSFPRSPLNIFFGPYRYAGHHKCNNKHVISHKIGTGTAYYYQDSDLWWERQKQNESSYNLLVEECCRLAEVTPKFGFTKLLGADNWRIMRVSLYRKPHKAKRKFVRIDTKILHCFGGERIEDIKKLVERAVDLNVVQLGIYDTSDKGSGCCLNT